MPGIRLVVPRAALLALTLAAGRPLAHAEEVPAPLPPPPPLPRTITLAESLRVGFQSSPEIQIALADVRFYEGAYRSARGPFNTVLSVSPFIEHDEAHLTAGATSNEDKKRRGYQALAEAFTRMHDEVADIIAKGSTDLPVCPSGLTIYADTANESGIPQPVCRPAGDQPADTGVGRYDPQQLTSTAALFNPTAGDSDLAQFEERIAELLGLQISDFAEGLKQEGLERIEQSERLSREFATRSFLSLERLGPIPTYEWTRTAALDLRLSKMSRDGRTFQLLGHLEGMENNYRGKPLDPIFGGKGAPNAFRSRLSLVVNQPLFRGRGSVATAAGERAAKRNYEAAQERYAHAVSRQSLAIASSYFDLVAAQSTLALLEDSVKSQKNILEGNRILKKAGELARADVTRSEARLADMETQAATARINVLAAQTALANNTGWAADGGLLAMVPQEKLQASPPEIDLAPLARGAVAARHDLRAAESSTEAARLLRDAAHVNARPRLDLQVRAGFTGDYFGTFFRVNKDETVAASLRRANNASPNLRPYLLEPSDSPVDFYNPVGMWRSLTDNLQPEVSVRLTLELPFGNRRQRGRLAQAEASYKQADIRAADLARVITHDVNERMASVTRTRSELDARRRAVLQYEETWKATRERRAAGDMTLIDVLKTEQDYTSARVQLVQAQRDYAAKVAQLRFDAGTLVPMKDNVPGAPDLSGLLTQ